jgi:hypothetical protein
MDMSKVGLEYAQGQESQAEKLARQQYEDSISNSRYSDSQTQQTLDNTYRQSQANIDNAYRQSQASQNSSSDKQAEKEMQSLRNDSATWIFKLGSRSTDWGTAWNSLRTKYPLASNELLDEMLQKDKYYRTTVKSKNDTSSVGYFNPISNRLLNK